MIYLTKNYLIRIVTPVFFILTFFILPFFASAVQIDPYSRDEGVFPAGTIPGASVPIPSFQPAPIYPVYNTPNSAQSVAPVPGVLDSSGGIIIDQQTRPNLQSSASNQTPVDTTSASNDRPSWGGVISDFFSSFSNFGSDVNSYHSPSSQSLSPNAFGNISTNGFVYNPRFGVTGLFTLFRSWLGLALPIIVSLAVVWFAWNAFFYAVAGNEDDKSKARTQMIWGVLGIFVMVSVWGLVAILQNTFGTNRGAPSVSATGESTNNTTIHSIVPTTLISPSSAIKSSGSSLKIGDDMSRLQ